MVILSSLADYLHRVADYRRTRRLLNDLDDRLLADIGIQRSDIDAVARRGFTARRSAAETNDRSTQTSRPTFPATKLPNASAGYV